MEDDFEKFDDDLSDDFLRSLPMDFPQLAPTTSLIDLTTELPDCRDEPPEEFPFPFEPYDIQVGFMKSLFQALELKKVGIFESPTGTGKSLSIICGALTWLKHYEEKQSQELEALLKDESSQKVCVLPHIVEPKDEPDWITAFAKKQEKVEQQKKLKEDQEQRLKREARLKELRSNVRPACKVKRKRDTLEDQFDELFKDASKELKEKLSAELESSEQSGSEAEDSLLVTEYISDDEDSKKNSEGDDNYDDDNDTEYVTKVYYCSRTHSQLAQFVREVQKSPFGEDTRVISLGSRQNLCVNDAVKGLKALNLINDSCLELQKNKSASKKKSGESLPKQRKSTGGCPFHKQEAMLDYRDRALVEIKDIEQLAVMGKKMKACPYYGTRYAIPASQLVVLPYNILLHKSTREACGIRLRRNIVIIDEAHNLVETISSVHSMQISGTQLMCAHSQLTQYMERYKSRLKAKNLMYINQILFILTSFVKGFGGVMDQPAEFQTISGGETRLMTINDFLFNYHLDNLNLFKVKKYCERSMISKKLHGFVEKYQPPAVVPTAEKRSTEAPSWALSKFLEEINQIQDANSNMVTDSAKSEGSPAAGKSVTTLSSPLRQIEGFLEALTNADKDGRIVVNRKGLLSNCSLKFLLLNPAVHFADIVTEARAVIVAGGTMQPLSEFKDQLFFSAGVEPERILEYSCGHVIPPDQLLPLALARGSSGYELDFTYQARNTEAMMEELGRVVYNVCNIIPGGVILFFPSYEYEKTVYGHWEKSGFLGKISSKKKVFREPKMANQVDAVLSEYTSLIKKHLSNKYTPFNGAVIFAVVGGKMSEGINFSDDLGRCVVMVGLPYPNIKSPELREKMDYLNANMPNGPDGRLPGQVHYENLCMKAVNQSIGRAIRHKNDYACILLLDHRYLRTSVKTKLPTWIGEKLQTMDRFGPAFAAVRKFFAGKQTGEA